MRFTLLISVLVCTPIASAATSCESVASIALRHATITTATTVEAGAFPAPPGRGPNAGAVYKTLPAFCRVAATLKPSSDSDIKIEVWMPALSGNGLERQTAIGRERGMGGDDQLSRAGHRAGRRVCRRQHGHRPRRQQSRLHYRPSGEGRRFRVSRGPRDDGSVQRQSSRLTTARPAILLLEWLFDGRPPGDGRSAAISGRL